MQGDVGKPGTSRAAGEAPPTVVARTCAVVLRTSFPAASPLSPSVAPRAPLSLSSSRPVRGVDQWSLRGIDWCLDQISGTNIHGGVGNDVMI